MKILKSIGPSIELCGTPSLINLNKLRTPFIFTVCDLSSKTYRVLMGFGLNHMHQA